MKTKLISAALLILSVSAALVFAQLEISRFDRVAKWNSFLNQVPIGSGMILTSKDADVDLGQTYKIPIAKNDEVIINYQEGEAISPMHEYAMEATDWPLATVPGRLWYADRTGKILGSYDLKPGGPDNLYVYMTPKDVPNCEYSGNVKIDSLPNGLTFVQIWSDGGSFSSTCLYGY